MTYNHPEDWDGTTHPDPQHPIMIQFLTHEQWISSNGDIVRAIRLLERTLANRRNQVFAYTEATARGQMCQGCGAMWNNKVLDHAEDCQLLKDIDWFDTYEGEAQ